MHYDQYQQTFALSALANWVGDRRGSQPVLQADYQATLLQTLASADTQDRIGDWQLVWGPQVWQAADSSLSGNAMYVAHTDAMPGIGEAYVVALSATNPESLYDWFTEDFDVSSVVDFATYTPLLGTAPVAAKKPVKPGSAVISMGAATGVWHLLNMVSPSTALAPNTTLLDFLQALDGSKATVIFAGHSLGGALSPTLATWLKTNGKLDNFSAVHCYPTAGATPGNGGFAALYAQALPSPAPGAAPYQIWNADLWNTLDCVPHAWTVPMLSQIKTLYGNAPIKEIDVLVDVAIANAVASTVNYRQIANQPLTGTLTGTPTTVLQFLEQMASQHTTAYQALIAPWLTPVSGTPQSQSADGAPARDALIERLTAHAGQAALADADKIEAVSAALGSMAKTLFKQL
ncbi:lipase family protein [Xanthomonas arboricola]|uniref:lipase family protein n=1 Tax=Xanthomonas arboricola TaxID=56448 RepID=UPI000CEDE1AB|nr:hypothetical protein [Xanthomonas arboricola]MBB5862018.1 hypothetical protein [Xanthomonas arboricola]PPT59670.1 hypothetical protein XarbCFBP8153_10825 [Xanthomonas arboricola]